MNDINKLDVDKDWHHLDIALPPNESVYNDAGEKVDHHHQQQQQLNSNNNDNSLFGKVFYNDMNPSIYGEDVDLLSQPFIGYIRRHEKKFSYEIGEYSILLRESKQLLIKIRKELDSLLQENTGMNKEAYDALHSLNTYTMETMEWLFDIRKIYSKMDTYYGPSMNPIGSISQIRMLASYRKLLDDASVSGYDQQSVLVRENLDKIVKLLEKKLIKFGGIKSTMRNLNGSLDFDLPILDISEQEKVLILVEFIDALNHDFTKERKKLEDDNEGLRKDYNSLKTDFSNLKQDHEALLAKNAALESSIRSLEDEKLLLEKKSIIPLQLLDELKRVECNLDSSLTDLHKLRRKSVMDMPKSPTYDFSDSISTKDKDLDETLSMSDASKMIVDDYTVNSSCTKDEFAESRKKSLYYDKSLKETRLAASFQGSIVPFVKLNLIPKLGGPIKSPWKKKQIIDRRNKAAEVLKGQNQFKIKPNLLVEAVKTAVASEQDPMPMINTLNDPDENIEASHMKDLSLLTTNISKKLNVLRRNSKILNDLHLDKISNQQQRSLLNKFDEDQDDDDQNNFESITAIFEEKDGGGTLRESFLSTCSVISDDDNSAYSASQVKLPNLALPYGRT